MIRCRYCDAEAMIYAGRDIQGVAMYRCSECGKVSDDESDIEVYNDKEEI